MSLSNSTSGSHQMTLLPSPPYAIPLRGLLFRGLLFRMAILVVMLRGGGCWAGELGLGPADFERELLPLIESHEGQVAVAVRLLDGNHDRIVEWSFEGNAVMPTASLIKLPIMVEAYRQAASGDLSLKSETVTLRDEDQVPGSGILTNHFSPGATFSVVDAIRLMIRYSDNTATNLVLDRIGLPATARTMAELGYPETQVHAKVFRRETSIAPERSRRYGLGSTTALDMVSLLTRIQRGQLISPEACTEMIGHLLTCDDSRKFPRLLPAGTKIAHKTGSVTRSKTAAGIIYVGEFKLVLCVLTDQNADTRWSDDNAGDLLCSSIAKAAYELVTAHTESGRVKSGRLDPIVLTQGARGKKVEALQRTINARTGAELAIDGEFGPATEAAVKDFQNSQGLPPTGAVNQATWAALGTLLTEPDPVPAPESINSERLEIADPLEPFGPPATSAKSWAVLDNSNGRLLASEAGDQQLPMASTTKIMVAYLILEMAESQPQVLEEMLTFSMNADQTPGSTSGLQAGEQVTVGELLYGLMLPSGNDASVALGEHFGTRLAGRQAGAPQRMEKGETASTMEAYELFVRAMNRKAKELRLENTHFSNTSGLPADDHYSSANDLARLAYHALKLPKMRKLVSTRQRGYRTQSIDGYERNVVWKNTNRLLRQAGFFGMKTGTTSSAGACLVACGTRSSQEHIVVVLGCPTSATRYVDARNLFAWSWRRLEQE